MFTEKPDWIRIKISQGSNCEMVEEILKCLSLHTVCQQASCPNIGECFCNKTATFMILGNLCARNCTFCQVSKGKPQAVDPAEPANVADAVVQLKLKHVVVTSVTRDDLPDGGSQHFAQVIKAIQTHCPQTTVEVLIPDFQGKLESLQNVITAKPTVINHNIETIERLYPQIRPTADYTRSLELLERVKYVDPEVKTKSGIMVGFGEKYQEVLKVMQDLRLVGCDFLTIGQYLAPSKLHHPVIEYIHPDIFENLKNDAEKLGFSYSACGPFVRSSYHAGEALQQMK